MKLLILLLSMSFASDAFARRSKRKGFNFGTTIRLLSDSRQISDEKIEIKEHTSNAVSPYIGYSFGLINIGVSAFVESSSTVFEVKDGSETTTIRDSTTTGGAHAFSRLLFGKFFFLEAGVGGAKITATKNSSLLSDNIISNESFESSGVGLSYQVGGGLEAPIGLGFFFTSGFYNRSLILKDVQNVNKSLNSTKSEFVFGIAQYL